MDNNQGKPNMPKKPKRPNMMWLYFSLIMLLIGLFMLEGTSDPGQTSSLPFFSESAAAKKDLSYTDLQAYMEKDVIESVVVYDNAEAKAKVKKDQQVVVFGQAAKDLKGDAVIEVQTPGVQEFNAYLEELNKTREEQGLKKIDVSFKKDRNYLYFILVNILPFVLLILFFVWMSRGAGSMSGGIFGVGKAKAQVFDKNKKDKVTFKDVAGLEGAKQEIQEIVAFLKNPQKYTELGGKIPKGALLVGPPGTGKTLLAKAVAGEADVPFFSMSGSDFVEMFVGVGASRVRDLFRQAKEAAPSIIFIDEIDAVGRARGKNVISGGNDERESTLNQLLTEMDGFGTNSGVIILAATNRAEILDPALLRAGRFDRQIHVELPDLQERIDIFNVHLRPIKLDPSVDVQFLAKQTPGFSGADISNVCNEAALIAARHNKKKVDKQDFMDAVDRIVGGLERKNKIMTMAEKRAIAMHEAGHATVSWMLEGANPLVKVTIVPRGMALGAAWYLPEERQLVKQEFMLDEMCATLGGRAAEELFLSQTSTGALNDLEKVNKQAYAMVAYYGMSDRLKNICYYDSTGQQQYSINNPYSEHTAQIIDEEVRRMIAEQMERAKKILKEHEAQHHAMADLLIEKEVITHEDVEAILGPRQWKSRGDEIIADNQTKEAEKSDEQILAEAKALYEAEQQAQNSDSPSEPDTEQPEQDDKQA
ncbi:MAG: ATP-dependent zinc metalloprotease FtsH [Paludibacteraceae bacterium]|nr:ATP-dependent zinc metalloprotease FtsH [Paludibacteraceae bacterium]MBQ3913971.1 ATP-dependent zinc metalloprotease FtsH [Paludibacteraceae bacterium]